MFIMRKGGEVGIRIEEGTGGVARATPYLAKGGSCCRLKGGPLEKKGVGIKHSSTLAEEKGLDRSTLTPTSYAVTREGEISTGKVRNEQLCRKGGVHSWLGRGAM